MKPPRLDAAGEQEVSAGCDRGGPADSVVAYLLVATITAMKLRGGYRGGRTSSMPLTVPPAVVWINVGYLISSSLPE